mmetsp:Transcript_102543/g.265166  ORF Transcript_102543/g.265166 Transcript_102543/m.265166 type:complete len:208 (+) Transcript_102543:793-1416(+)
MTMRSVEITTWLIMKSTSAAASATAMPWPSARKPEKCTKCRTCATHCSTTAAASVLITGCTIPTLRRNCLQLTMKRARKALRLRRARIVAAGIQRCSMLKCEWSAWRITSSNSMSLASRAPCSPQPESAKYQRCGLTDCANSPPTQGPQPPWRLSSTIRCVWRASWERRQAAKGSTRCQSSSRKTSRSTLIGEAPSGSGLRSLSRRS